MLLSDPTSRRQPLHLTRPSPPSGWPEDLHLQTAEHAQHTTKPRCGIRRTLRWSAFHPSVSLRCEAVRSPLSPRSQVLTFLRSLASSEANPEKMFSACFSAPPRLRVKQHLSNSTRSRPRRNTQKAIALPNPRFSSLRGFITFAASNFRSFLQPSRPRI